MAQLYVRTINKQLERRIREPRQFMQVLCGPRQVGKTTAIKQILEKMSWPSRYASADRPALHDSAWLEEQWEVGRSLAKRRNAVLVIDEIQKAPGWSEVVKRLWDEDTFDGSLLRVVLLGSSPLLAQKGLTESLAGRFEMVRAGHWSFAECEEHFGWDLDTYIFFGGYPGAAPLLKQPERWARYIQESLIETTISRDILLMTRVDKPALLRRLFALGCEYSGQILSYQKMLGQLRDAGNTTTLAHYLELLSGVGFLTGLGKFSGQAVRKRGSSPKLHVYNTALITAQSGLSLKETREDHVQWGRLVESAVGGRLLEISMKRNLGLFYWREGDREVDFVVQAGNKIVAIEVKSARTRHALPGMAAFASKFAPRHKLLVGKGGIPVEEFLKSDLSQWL
ncbi:MAG: AAA family ATPase [Candidatus Anoxymicrobium japonicum]|uniref:AAA family ATPase n=1 Tax=Candidatus Anoxymicrobium japonicum TaxID=2013648 RepID=A0A2N3G8D2_9ACTN|nr:MAG: AAA family ATPase [Candidatus Anoxymicrobium japonicum]